MNSPDKYFLTRQHTAADTHHNRSMTNATVAQVSAALRASWDRDTAFADDAFRDRDSTSASRGQCGPSSLVLQDMFGGELFVADVFAASEKIGVHYWNRLADGTVVDLTGDQFLPDETIGPARVLKRPPGVPPRGADAYLLLKSRVLALLSASDAP